MKKISDIIYIAGYGRSGSTLLEKLLHCQPAVCATGELANFFKLYGSSTSLCSCGETTLHCPVWSRVAESLLSNGYPVEEYPTYSKIQKKHEALWTHHGSLFSKNNKTYSNLMCSFFDAVAQSLDTEKSVLIDSSKTAYATPYRPVAISQLGKYRLRVIHLVRDCRGVAWSVKKGLNRKLEAGEKKGNTTLPVTRAMLGWAYGNMAAGRLKYHLDKDSYYLMRYEDLVENPVQSLKQLESFLHMNLDHSINIAQKANERSGCELPTMHQLTGNRMRFNSRMVIRPDFNWKTKSNRLTSLWLKAMLFPLMKKYGYI